MTDRAFVWRMRAVLSGKGKLHAFLPDYPAGTSARSMCGHVHLADASEPPFADAWVRERPFLVCYPCSRHVDYAFSANVRAMMA